MKQLFVEARYREKVRLPKKLTDILPKRVALFTTIQFIDSIHGIKKDIEDSGRKVLLFKPKHAKYKGQILGCNIGKFNADGFLFIGDGMFHPMALLIRNNKPVFILNPGSGKFRKLGIKDAEKIIKHEKGAYLKFLTSKNIGVLVSTKHGQNDLKSASGLRKRFRDKKFYILVSDTINFSDLEDFNFIDCYVNTACPRISIDDSGMFSKKIINIDKIKKSA